MRNIVILLMAALVFGFVDSTNAETSPLWGNLTPGAHDVGFQIMFQKDPSRPYKPKRDYQGNEHQGDRSRPIQISVWYPVDSTAGSNQVSFQDYLFATASEETGIEATEQQKQNAVMAFKNRWVRQASDEAIRSALAAKTMAWHNPAPAKKKYPLVLIAPSVGLSSPVGSALLCEYLASHGYVVASSPGMGLSSRQLSFDSLGTITQMQDMQFIISHLRSFPSVDPDKLAAIGFSFGGLSTALLAMYNGDVDALVSLESSVANKFGYSVLFQNPLYEPARLKIPVLHLTAQEANDSTDDAFMRAVKYAPVTAVKLKGMTPGDFSSFTMVTPLIPVPPDAEGNTPPDKRQGYEAICRYTAQFLNAKVKKDPQAEAFLRQQPEQNGIAAGLAVVETRASLKIPPSEEEFMQILKEKGLQAASLIQKETRSKDPDYHIFDPETVLNMARELSEQKKTQEAIDLLKFNVESYPDFWESYELMGTIYMNDGKKDLAIQHFETVLEYDPANQNAAEMLKKLKS